MARSSSFICVDPTKTMAENIAQNSWKINYGSSFSPQFDAWLTKLSHATWITSFLLRQERWERPNVSSSWWFFKERRHLRFDFPYNFVLIKNKCVLLVRERDHWTWLSWMKTHLVFTFYLWKSHECNLFLFTVSHRAVINDSLTLLHTYKLLKWSTLKVVTFIFMSS
jgi:hypothetical protein